MIRPFRMLSRSVREPAFERLSGRALSCFALACLLSAPALPQTVVTVAPQAQEPASNTISLSAYQARLMNLDRIVTTCQGAMTPANCQSEQVGPDIRLAFPSGTRRIRLAWLRGLLNAAGKSQPAKAQPAAQPAGQPAAPKTPNSEADSGDDDPDDSEAAKQPGYTPPALAQQLEAARKRLAADYQAAEQASGQSTSQPNSKAASAAAKAAPDFTPQRQTLTRILAAKEYHATVVGPSLLSRVFEKIGNWIDRALEKLREAGFHSKWIGLGAEIGFVLLLCIGLVWFLIRLERQGRLGLALIRPGSGTGAASERDWQLWLADARSAAAQGAWRDAIHLLYWASVSRLESAGLWPADRARTPREYLALLSRESAERPDLATLTRSFERTWYAGRAAAEADFREAEQVAARLGAR